jgi:FlaA1/EpsC-like NDP-sugar epimerase
MIYNQAFLFGWISGGLLYVMMAAISIIMLGANKYFSFISRPFTETAAKTFSLVIMLNFIYIALLYFSRSIQLSLYYFIITDTLQVLFLLMIKKITFVMKTNIFKNRVSLVIGKNREKNQLLRELKRKTIGRLAFAAYDDEKLKEYVDQAHNVFVSGILSKRLKDQIISYCILKDKKVFIVPETYEIAMRKAEMTQVGDIPLFAIESLRLTEAQSIIKRFIDILLAVTGILLSSPLMLYAAVRIKLEDGGPVFYKQVRSGLNGRQFNLIKFRSMIVDAERNTGAVFAQENDPRSPGSGV